MPGGHAGPRPRHRGLLPELSHRADRSAGRLPQHLPGLDPAVLHFGRGGLSAQQDQAVRIPLHPRRDLGHVGHERGGPEQEVIGREDGDGGLGIPPRDPVGRIEHAGRGPAVERLGEDRGPGRRRELLRDVARVVADRHHQGAALRDGEAHPVQRLAQQGTRAEKRHVLLRAIVADDLPHERAEAHALAAGEHHRPARVLSGHEDGRVE